MGLKQITAASDYPVTLAEAKLHLRVTSSEQDSLITNLIGAATKHCQQITDHTFMRETWEKTLDKFPAGAIELPKPPIYQVDSIKFIDVDNIEQTLNPAHYIVDTANYPGWVQPRYGYTWPDTYPEINAVRVRFTCGYADADVVPEDIKQSMLLLIAHWYENREATTNAMSNQIEFAVSALLSPYKMWRI